MELKFKYCPYCGNKLEPIIDTDINSRRLCKNELCENSQLYRKWKYKLNLKDEINEY